MVSAAPATRPPVTGIVRSSFDLLEIVDALPEGATGELVLRNAAAATIGIVFIEDRRVCWVAARGFAGRLSDLLRARTKPPLDAPEMENVFRQCQREGKRLGEHLVSQSLLAASDLRDALLDHSIECLHQLGETRVSVRFLPRIGTSYSADFTFSTGELATAVGVLAHGQSVAAELTELASYQPHWGAIFARHPAHAQPLPLAQHSSSVSGGAPERECSTARTLHGVGRWAVSALDLAGALDGVPPLASFADASKGGVVMWSTGGLVCVACFVEQAPFARAISRRASRSK